VAEEKGTLVDLLALVLELVEDEAVRSTDVEKVSVFVVAFIDSFGDLHNEVFVFDLESAETFPLG
jgi:hypothetical protein